MIESQAALMRRELWEHRSIYITPAVVALLVCLLSLTGQVSISGIEHVDTGLIGLSNMPDNVRGAAISGIMIGMSVTFVIALRVLTIFYSLDALYAERKDRSILFWRSMPCTDAETVLSKLLVALLVIPLVTFVVIVATHLVVLLINSAWLVARGANPWQLIWSVAPFFDNWTATLIFLLASSAWLSPYMAWFLFVSAFAKRSPFLVAFLPIAVLPLFEKILIGSSVLWEAFVIRAVNVLDMPLFTGLEHVKELVEDGEGYHELADANLSLLSFIDPGNFLSSPDMWAGLIVCALFTTAAIYVRRYRDDS